MKHMIFKIVFLLVLPVMSQANTIFTVEPVRTFNQSGNCLCAAYSMLHALSVRYLKREGKTIFIDPRSVQWSQIFDRYQEQIIGYRNNAVLDACFTESPYPHDVVRQIMQYGTSLTTPNRLESVPSFSHENAINLLSTINLENSRAAKTQRLLSEMHRYLGPFPGNIQTAKEVLKNDRWIGVVPSEGSRQQSWTPFIPPAMFQNEMPMPAAMPSVVSVPRAKIFKQIIQSIKAGNPVPYCADTHCRSIDGIELDANGNIVRFLYADTYGIFDYKWDSSQDPKSAYNAFLYVILAQ